ncbi:uncharacterized protein DUF4123 [Litoreibacter ponti]|uniref:Uncharacterized protein DUF4123 n=1 Tax=Litoreibacter ponti TaxID=1510457 RepID=A0A2T6BHE4_9RHOB|nr:DUF4123 domain-containing protein [Litoreibacter ponti]PTX55488.1 uncharacterized protein DUF4123 [Litoreibacter ponti]
MPGTACLEVAPIDVKRVPAQPNVPFWDRTWIDPDLFELLFGDPSQRTYLVVDACLRTNITKVFDLDSQDLPVRCLFQGEAEERFRESAPHLVDLTVHESGATRFHREFFAEHWEKGTGILLCSDAPMDTVWKHLRKFTRTRSIDGPDRFFRFWETNTARDYFEAIAKMPSRCKDLFQIKGGGWISVIVSYADQIGQAHKIIPNKSIVSTAAYSNGEFTLTPTEDAALLKGVLRGRAKSVEMAIPPDVSEHTPAEREHYVFEALMEQYSSGVRDIEQIKAAAVHKLQEASTA